MTHETFWQQKQFKILASRTVALASRPKYAQPLNIEITLD